MKLSLIDRSKITLENYIASKIGGHFYSDAYLSGICQRRNEAYAKQAKQIGVLFILTSVLAFFDLLGGSIDVGAFSIPISHHLSSVLAVVVSTSLLGVVLATLDQILLDRYIDAIGNKAGLWSFKLYLLDRTAINLWMEPLIPKYFGPRSTAGHEMVFRIFGIFGIVTLLAMFGYPTVICGLNVYKLLQRTDVGIIEFVMAGMSVLICLFSWSMIAMFSFKYTFEEADFNEADGSPTPEFIARQSISTPEMQEDAAANGVQGEVATS